MKVVLLLSLAFAAISQAADIYIVAGQSNGWRLSSLTAGPGKGTHAVHYFGMGCTTRHDTAKHTFIENVNPTSGGSGIATALLEHSKTEIVFIQYCVCGTSLGVETEWYPGDDPAKGLKNDRGIYGSFTRYLADVRQQVEALGIEWKVSGLFWHQGESDVKRDSATHQKNLTNLIFRFREDLGADLPIVAGHIRDLDEASRGINRALDTVDAADVRFTVVNLDNLDFESPTDVHIKPASCIVLGRRMVEAWKQLR